MKRIAKFEKVSFKEFLQVYKSYNLSDEEIKLLYDNIILPKRATSGSAGYDFYNPIEVKVNPKETCLIATGIRVNITGGWLLKIYPRSSMGFKYQMSLVNTVGIIDSDYYYADNEGHIMIKIYNGSDKVLEIKKEDRFAQGIFSEYGITIDDEANETRHGGFGSTNK